MKSFILSIAFFSCIIGVPPVSAGEFPVEIDPSSCQMMLNGWDQMSERPKASSMNRLCSCALRYGKAGVNNGLSKSKQQIRANGHRLQYTAEQQLSDKVQTERSLNEAEYSAKLSEHIEKFRAKKAALLGRYAKADSMDGYTEELHEIVKQRKEERKELEDERTAKKQDLREREKESLAIIVETISKMKSDASWSVARQHEQFINSLEQNTKAICQSFTSNSSIAEIENQSSKNPISDESPIGYIEEMRGSGVQIIRTDGTTEIGAPGTLIYQDDTVETDENTSVEVAFDDGSSFAISDNAYLKMDEYIYDPDADSAPSKFSILRGVFIFTSGLIGRDDPDDANIETPVGEIGIRG